MSLKDTKSRLKKLYDTTFQRSANRTKPFVSGHF
nr:MAG TPA: hypothetical protein [Caudoviricetes sp.]